MMPSARTSTPQASIVGARSTAPPPKASIAVRYVAVDTPAPSPRPAAGGNGCRVLVAARSGCDLHGPQPPHHHNLGSMLRRLISMDKKGSSGGGNGGGAGGENGGNSGGSRRRWLARMEAALEAACAKDMKERLAGLERLHEALEAAARRGLSAAEATALVDTCMDLTRDANFRVAQGGLQALSAAAVLTGEHFKIHLNALVPAAIERLGDGKQPVRDAARQLLLTLMENLPAPPANGGKLPGLSQRLLFQKAPESKKKVLTEVKNGNTRTLAMVLRSERELLVQSKEQEDEIADFVPPDIETVGYRVFLGHKQYFVSSDVGAGKMQWYAFHKEPAGGTDVENGKRSCYLAW